MHEPIPYEHNPDNSMRDILFVFFRHSRKIMVFSATVLFLVALGTFLSPEMYESTSKLMIRLGRESVALDPTATTGQTVPIYQDRQQEINSELEILGSRELAEKVVDTLGVDTFLKRPDETVFNGSMPLGMARDTIRKSRETVRNAVEKPARTPAKAPGANELIKRDRAIIGLMKDLKIETSRESNIITISYEAQSPRIAQAVVSGLIDAYMDKHIEVHYSKGSYDFFTDQTKSLQQNLSGIEEELKQVKNETGISSLEEQRTIALNRMGLLQQEIERNDAALAASRAKIAALEMTLGDTPRFLEVEKTDGFSNQALDLMRARLYELQLREQDLLSRYAESQEQVQDIRREIKEAQTLLEKETPALTQKREAINEAYRQTELDLLSERTTFQSLQANGGALRTLLRNVQNEIKEINNNETRIASLQREKEIQETNYRKYSDNLEQSRIDDAMQKEKLSNIAIVQAATSPMKPVRPKKMMNLALGLILGLVGGIGFAFTSEYVDHTIKRPLDIERKLQMPVLASISDFRVKQKRLPSPDLKSTAIARRT